MQKKKQRNNLQYNVCVEIVPMCVQCAYAFYEYFLVVVVVVVVVVSSQ